MARRIDLFSAGRPLCVSDEGLVRGVAGAHQEVVIRDFRTDKAAGRKVAERGIRTASADVVDVRLLGCCNNAGPDCDDLVAVGVTPPPG